MFQNNLNSLTWFRLLSNRLQLFHWCKQFIKYTRGAFNPGYSEVFRAVNGYSCICDVTQVTACDHWISLLSYFINIINFKKYFIHIHNKSINPFINQKMKKKTLNKNCILMKVWTAYLFFYKLKNLIKHLIKSIFI